MGVATAVGVGLPAFEQALFEGAHRFAVMRRPGRQRDTAFIGAEIASVPSSGRLPAHVLRTASLSSRVALATLEQAWQEAALDDTDPQRVGLVVGGSNLQQRELVLLQERHRDAPGFMPPSYAMTFLDSDVCGLCTQAFGIRGFAHACGGASAAGQLAIIEAAEAVTAGRVDACVALGPMMDLSYWECLALQSSGAMVCDGAQDPGGAYRPFDRRHAGFVYGEACAALVVERAGARRLPAAAHGRIAGWAVQMDANRNPNPSVEGEAQAVAAALAHAGWQPKDVDYVNPHGTGSPLGDTTELKALRACGLAHAAINATKSITGHGLAAAGAVEAVATLVQMKRGWLHPTRNLREPLDPDFGWVADTSREMHIGRSLSLSMGFGGMNTALCLTQ
ncbi:MAG: polyketide beta-ketoacyl:ACP synthase [Burkholderiales bacterium]|nr:polyketide beta-ketoacyl:ACP synthase [Burkholderiales bacterium]